MKRKNKGKNIIIALIVIVIVIVVLLFAIRSGAITFETYGGVNPKEEEKYETEMQSELQNGCLYVYSDGIYHLCTLGTRSWDVNKNTSSVPHTIWYLSDNDRIPVFKPGDTLVYISSTNVPFDGITWERFADYGYTIGVSNLIGDESGHYHITRNGDNGYVGYVDPDSDADELEALGSVEHLFIDKIGNIPVRENLVSDGGTILELEKDTEYICEWYTGSYYQDYKLTANVHAFGFLEKFTTYNYSFTHSNCIEIGLPSYLKSGVYDLNGIGMFRYVSERDVGKIDGNVNGSSIEWNDPIVVVDDDGRVLYDPIKGEISPEYDPADYEVSEPASASGNSVNSSYNNQSSGSNNTYTQDDTGPDGWYLDTDPYAGDAGDTDTVEGDVITDPTFSTVDVTDGGY